MSGEITAARAWFPVCPFALLSLVNATKTFPKLGISKLHGPLFLKDTNAWVTFCSQISGFYSDMFTNSQGATEPGNLHFSCLLEMIVSLVDF